MLIGVNYDAMHNAEYPLHGGSVNAAALGHAIDRDFAQISKHFKYARTFYSSFYNVPVAPYAAKYGVKLFLGVFMTDESWTQLKLMLLLKQLENIQIQFLVCLLETKI